MSVCSMLWLFGSGCLSRWSEGVDHVARSKIFPDDDNPFLEVVQKFYLDRGVDDGAWKFLFAVDASGVGRKELTVWHPFFVFEGG
ncbi:hypothetical protein QBC44DRAFT_54040 [Cladorrhinum sp. PSN332]|nr:hypothetical protein QBC44DRAFT_54040 [Cladorrhinum sp. PSN332]